MKKTFLLFFILISLTGYAQTFDYEQVWGTYFGNESVILSDNAIDNQGSIYFVGYLKSDALFSSTQGSFQTSFGGGEYDGFIVKMNKQGEILWATYFGGEGTDLIQGITIDENNNLYLIGSTSSDIGISTSGAYQPTKDGISDNFIACFTSNGQRFWASYFPDIDQQSVSFSPGGILESGLSIVTDNRFIYFYVRTSNPNMGTSGVFQEYIGQTSNNLIAKFKVDGEFIWASYYGINLSNIYSIALSTDGLYIAGQTRDTPPQGSYNTYFGTLGSFRETPYTTNGNPDIFITKFSFSGERLWSTYYGNKYQDFIDRHAMVIDGDNLYVTAMGTFSEDITTPGSYQENNGGNIVPYIVKFNTDGNRAWGTYIGLDLEEEFGENRVSGSMLAKDTLGNIYISGQTRFKDNIITANAFQIEKNGRKDLFVAIFNSYGDKLYGSYFGGEDNEYTARPIVHGNNLYLSGMTLSTTGITTSNSIQPILEGTKNVFVAKFSLPESDSTNSISVLSDVNIQQILVYPNPTNNTINFSVQTNVQLTNVTGQIIANKTNVNTLDISGQPTGIYFVTLTNDKGQVLQRSKIVKE